jgi:hypothetical protein
MAQAGVPPQKRPYSPPILTVYGTIRELTQKTGQSGMADGARPPIRNTKTHIG